VDRDADQFEIFFNRFFPRRAPLNEISTPAYEEVSPILLALADEVIE
jgi:hypothetical protein